MATPLPSGHDLRRGGRHLEADTRIASLIRAEQRLSARYDVRGFRRPHGQDSGPAGERLQDLYRAYDTDDERVWIGGGPEAFGTTYHVYVPETPASRIQLCGTFVVMIET
jgi:hypothetical protein